MQSYMQKFKYEKEQYEQQVKQLHHKNAEVEQRYSRVLEELDNARRYFHGVITVPIPSFIASWNVLYKIAMDSSIK